MIPAEGSLSIPVAAAQTDCSVVSKESSGSTSASFVSEFSWKSGGVCVIDCLSGFFNHS
jgi:hypothetical protein